MEYHEPDGTWELFGYKDYESYLNNCVIKGLFHQAVPKDIVDSYKVAEYMMAFAYYQYSLYDEAASKIMLVIEMAIRIRCENLGIPLTEINDKGLTLDKKLNRLINNFNQVEPQKQLKSQLDSARRLRNSRVHSKSHGFVGLIAKGFILNSVILLNKIFFDKLVLKKFNDQLKSVKKNSKQFRNRLHVLEFNEQRYLIHCLDFTSCLFINKEWIYTLAADPVVINKSESLKNHLYALPFTLTIKELQIEDGILKCCEIVSGKELVIQPTNHSANIKTYNEFLKSISSASKTDIEIYMDFYNSELFKAKNKFLHEWLWKS